MNAEEIIGYVTTHPAGKVKIAFTDIDGVLRGKYISSEKFLSVNEGNTSFCDVIFGWDVADGAYDNTSFTGWHSGYPDCPAKIDLASFRKIPWEGNLPFFLGDFYKASGEASAVCPRQLLKKVIADAGVMGYTASFAQEFEWYNFAETPQSATDKGFQRMQPLTPGMFGYSVLRTTLQNPFFTDLFGLLKEFGVPLEGLHTETGPGTFEAAITHANPLEAADRAVLFKTGVKEIAYKHGVMATFMAKVKEQLPGSGGHIHQSLWQGGRNVFYDAGKNHNMSAVMQHYVAGQLAAIPFILPMLAPTVNSYKRLVEGAWAPTTLTWGLDNRTVALRVLANTQNACRLETRIPGADVNPYLATAALLAAGLYGIRHQSTLQPVTTGNGYKDFSNGVLPTTLEQATAMMKSSAIAAELFGGDFVKHFVQTREWEWKQHLKAVTDWEYQRYFEII